MKFLVKKGADVLAKNCHSRTPLEEARKSLTKNTGIADVVAFLARHQVGCVIRSNFTSCKIYIIS